MAENSAYFSAIVAARSMKLDPHDQDTTLSLETCQDLMTEHMGTYIQENFPWFIKHIRHLSLEDQEMLLSYYLLSKPQWCIAKLYRSTQTVCSFKLRMAAKKLGTITIFGRTPLAEDMATILETLDLNHLVNGVSTAELVVTYRQLHSFNLTALRHRVHRPDVRRALSKVVKVLLAGSDKRELALGAYIHGLIDKASSSGQGYTHRKTDKHTHVFKQDPQILAAFRVDVMSPDFDNLFVSRACY